MGAGARRVYTPEIHAERIRNPEPRGASTCDRSKAPGYLVALHNRMAVVTA